MPSPSWWGVGTHQLLIIIKIKACPWAAPLDSQPPWVPAQLELCLQVLVSFDEFVKHGGEEGNVC